LRINQVVDTIGMLMYEIIFFLLIVFIYALVSRKLKQKSITDQMIFVLAGIISGIAFSTQISLKEPFNLVLLIAELTLVLVLFSDASRIGLAYTIREHTIPLRLLSIGMPLTIFLGVVSAALLLTNLSIWEAAILGAVLAPTDAALGKTVFESKKLPEKMRKGLEIESGLNDGLAVPFLVLFIAWSIAEETFHPVQFFVETALIQILFAVAIGLGVGLIGGWLISRARDKKWITKNYLGIALLSLAIFSWFITDQIGGSGFIAAFVGGLSAGFILKYSAKYYTDFAATEGNFLVLAMFFILGILLVQYSSFISLPVILYAVLSLTVIRMLPVVISLIGTKTGLLSSLFIGWFGPRGLASIVLILIALEEQMNFPGENTLLITVLITVLFSIFAHGLSAGPLSELYSRRIGGKEE
jgi:NhaP-type Na+/H+ or K+/H+ antiporter